MINLTLFHDEFTYKVIIEFVKVRGCVGVGEANSNRRLQEQQVSLWQAQKRLSNTCN
jgi:hypothetical protein